MERNMYSMKRRSSVRRLPLAHSSLVPHQVPEVLEDLTQFVLNNVETEGLFRVGGSAERVRHLQELLKNGESIPNNQPVHDVCTILKRWIRQRVLFKNCRLPLSPPSNMENLTDTLATMPADNVFILKHLCKFLEMVAFHSKENKMTVDNLAGILGENVFVSDCLRPSNAKEIKIQIEVIKESMKVLILNADVIDICAKTCLTPERSRKDDFEKMTFASKMKLYTSALKNFTIKRGRSLSLDRPRIDSKADFTAFPLTTHGKEQRMHLRERRETITQDTEELLERRHRAIARKHDELIRIKNKENAPAGGRTIRDTTLEEPQLLEWKQLPSKDKGLRSSNGSTMTLRYRVSNR